MPELDPELHLDYGSLVRADTNRLLTVLAETHSSIANLHIRIGFLKQEELRGQPGAKIERVAFEALKDAHLEQIWLLNKLLEYGNHD